MIGLVLALASQWLTKHQTLSFRLRLLLAVIPGALYLISLVRGIRGLDELERRIHFEAAAIAYVSGALLTLVFGGLERTGIYQARWSDIGNPLLFLWALGYVLAVRRYR
jgi:uncharacterized membrane protein